MAANVAVNTVNFTVLNISVCYKIHTQYHALCKCLPQDCLNSQTPWTELLAKFIGRIFTKKRVSALSLAGTEDSNPDGGIDVSLV